MLYERSIGQTDPVQTSQYCRRAGSPGRRSLCVAGSLVCRNSSIRLPFGSAAGHNPPVFNHFNECSPPAECSCFGPILSFVLDPAIFTVRPLCVPNSLTKGVLTGSSSACSSTPHSYGESHNLAGLLEDISSRNEAFILHTSLR